MFAAAPPRANTSLDTATVIAVAPSARSNFREFFTLRVLPKLKAKLFPEAKPLFLTAAYYRGPALISTMPRQGDGFMPRLQCSPPENSVSADFVQAPPGLFPG